MSRPHHSKSQRFSLLSSATLSLSLHGSPNSGHLKTSSHHIKVHFLLAIKPQAGFITFTAASCREKVALSSANRSFKLMILSHQLSTASTTTIIRILFPVSTRIFLLLSVIWPNNFTPPIVPARELHTPPGIFS